MNSHHWNISFAEELRNPGSVRGRDIIDFGDAECIHAGRRWLPCSDLKIERGASNIADPQLEQTGRIEAKLSNLDGPFRNGLGQDPPYDAAVSAMQLDHAPGNVVSFFGRKSMQDSRQITGEILEKVALRNPMQAHAMSGPFDGQSSGVTLRAGSGEHVGFVA